MVTTRSGHPGSVLSAQRRAVLVRRVRLLVTATIFYNLVEAIVGITAGVVASSVALIGFGLDSVIEVSSAAAVAWQFTRGDPLAREKITLRIIAGSFFALAGYVTVDAISALAGTGVVGHSTVGLILAAVSVVVMPVLSTAQRRVGRELGSRSAVADSKQTLLCTYLSGVVLIGLGLHSVFGWSWTDPIAGLIIAVIAVREGRQTWRGDGCCAVPASSVGAGAGAAAQGCGESADGCAATCGADCGADAASGT